MKDTLRFFALFLQGTSETFCLRAKRFFFVLRPKRNETVKTGPAFHKMPPSAPLLLWFAALFSVSSTGEKPFFKSDGFPLPGIRTPYWLQCYYIRRFDPVSRYVLKK